MKLIVGLGNPGPRYRDTRHNVGFEVLDELAARVRADFGSAPADALVARVRGTEHDALLAKPLTFMNLSGRAVGELARYYRIDVADMLVVTDDVNLQAGRLRLRRAGSAGGHNGLTSIIECLGSDAFARLRVGVGRGDPRRDLADHVLARVAPDEQQTLRDAVQRAADACETFIAEGIDVAMNRFNREPEDAPRPPEAR